MDGLDDLLFASLFGAGDFRPLTLGAVAWLLGANSGSILRSIIINKVLIRRHYNKQKLLSDINGGGIPNRTLAYEINNLSYFFCFFCVFCCHYSCRHLGLKSPHYNDIEIRKKERELQGIYLLVVEDGVGKVVPLFKPQSTIIMVVARPATIVLVTRS